MQNLNFLTALVFFLTTVLTVFLFYRAANRSLVSLLIISAWLLLQAILSLSGFYKITDTIPPRLLLFLLPPVVFIIVLFATVRGRLFINRLNPGLLTLLFVIRIPVEIVIYRLYLENQVPGLMTFTGDNYDIVSGLTAPLIYYFGYIKKRLSNEIMLAWNIICLGLLISIVYHAIFSAPSPIQKFAFDQPNLAILYFPYSWLPSCIVPLVLFSHLVLIWKLQKTIFIHSITL
jgi:hypothetical protein